MLQYLTRAAFAGVLILFAYGLVQYVKVSMEIAAKARSVGAQKAPSFKGGKLGLQLIYRMFEALKAQRIPSELQAAFEEISVQEGHTVSTWRSREIIGGPWWTSDPRNLQAMLSTQFDDYVLGDWRRNILEPVLGDGIFVQDGKAWEHSRALLRPNFVREQISDLKLEERHLRHMLQVLPVDEKGWTSEVNIQEMFFRLTLDSASEFLFGVSIDSQLDDASLEVSIRDQDARRAFAGHFDQAQKHLGIRLLIGSLSRFYFPKELKDNIKGLDRFISQYVDMALAKGAAPAEKAERYVFLDELATRTRDPKELRDQLLNILGAGRDTTASLLSWLFHELLRHPDIFEKLRAAILHDFGTFDEPKNLTFASLKDCRYLRHCLNESLRLWPVVPWNMRHSNKLTTLPYGGGPDGESPVVIPKDRNVNFSVHVMHRRKDLWGDDANEFRPERFEGRKPGWSFLPFSGGPRICIGQQFALTEASYVTVRLLQRFDRIEARSEELEGPVRSNLSMTNCPGRPVKLRLHAAS